MGEVVQTWAIGIAAEGANEKGLADFALLNAGVGGDELRCKILQDHVKATIAPYKYPRAIHFVEALPKTQTGKIQRFRLREEKA